MAITSDKSAIVRYQKPYFFPNNLNVPTWTRPSDWLSIPSISTGEQVVYALMAVYNDDSNYAAVSCLGNYTVDWGDGSQPQNYSSNTKAQYKFTYKSKANSNLYVLICKIIWYHRQIKLTKSPLFCSTLVHQ